MSIIETGKNVVKVESRAVSNLIDRIDDNFKKAVENLLFFLIFEKVGVLTKARFLNICANER